MKSAVQAIPARAWVRIVLMESPEGTRRRPSMRHVAIEQSAGISGMPAEAQAHDGSGLTRLESRYRILHKLGAGGGGQVFKATQLSTGQSVAVKILSVEKLDATSATRRVERFRREIAICSGLYHPDIVRLVDSGELSPAWHFAVFEYIPGITLAELLAQEGMLGVQRARGLLLQLLPPLAYAHQKGIAHRDLKPSNVMVLRDGTRDRPKILDFGISIATHDEADIGRLTLSHEWVGTPTYAAPEQLKGEPTGPKSDLYAWGLIFLECLTGTPVVRGRSLAEVVRVQLDPTPHVLPEVLARHRLGALLARVIEKDPVRRPDDAAQILHLLERIVVEDLEDPHGFLRDAVEGRVPSRAHALSDTLTDADEVVQVEQRHATLLCCRVALCGPNARADEHSDGLLEDAGALVAETLRHFGANPVPSLGMYTLGYFGAVHARDDDARMASRAALELASRLDNLQRRLQEPDMWLRAQIGLHSGPITVRRVASARHPSHGVTASTAMGLAEWLDDALEPVADSLTGPPATHILASAEYRLLASRHAEFSEAGPGPRSSVGAGEPIYRLLGESRLSELGTGRLPFAGRDAELQTLRRALREAYFEPLPTRAAAGVLIVGEAGMGKSRLAHELMSDAAGHGIDWLQARCLPEWRHAFLRPLAVLLVQHFSLADASPASAERLARAVARLGMTSADAVPLLCRWLSLPLPHRLPPLAWSPQKQRQLLLQRLVELLITIMERGAALLIEDIHWADSSTLDCLGELLPAAADRRALVVLTSRPGFKSAWAAQPAQVELSGLGPDAIVQMTSALLPSMAAQPLVTRQIVERSDGVPLFIEELCMALQKSFLGPQATEQGAQTSPLDVAVPVSLRDLLTSRLDAADNAKPTAQLAAALGREFAFDELKEAADGDEFALLGDLEQLVAAGVLVKRLRLASPVYAFRHALIRDCAYDGMRAEARALAHQRIAEGFERRFPDVVGAQPDVLAHHWEHAGKFDKALSYWQLAATRSRLASAHVEAIEQLDRALSLVEAMPAGAARSEQAARLLLARGATLVVKRGYTDPEANCMFERTLELLGASDAPEELEFSARWGLWYSNNAGAKLRAAGDLAGELAAIAQRSSDDSLDIGAKTALCLTSFCTGQLERAVCASRDVAQLYDFERHHHLATLLGDDPHLAALSFEALSEVLRGRHALMAQRLREGLALADRLNFPSLAAGMLGQAAWAYLVWGSSGALVPDVSRAREYAARALDLAVELGFPFWEIFARAIDAAARIASGDASGLEELQSVSRVWLATGARLGRCWHLTFIGQALHRRGQHAEAMATFCEALDFCEQTHSRFFEPEARRQYAEVLLDRRNPARDVARGLEELALAERQAGAIGASWSQLAALVTRLRFQQAEASGAARNDRERLCALLRDWPQSDGDPPLLVEGRALARTDT